jgi:predicted enzyme related to lactoylglutathione lyase
MTDISGVPVHHGAPSYIELCVEDADKARSFYGALLGWTVEGDAGPGQASTGGLGIGIHDRDPSSLLEVFFTVQDLESAVARVVELGGETVSEVHAENPAFGSWVECRDDQGVRFGLRQPSP